MKEARIRVKCVHRRLFEFRKSRNNRRSSVMRRCVALVNGEKRNYQRINLSINES